MERIGDEWVVDIRQGSEPARIETAWFCPNRPVSRAEMAAFMLRAVGESQPTPSQSHAFEDVPDGVWYTKFVHALAERGVDLGQNGRRSPTEPLTRLEMAHWVTRMFESIPPSADPRGLFEDVPFDNVADLAAVEGLFRSGVAPLVKSCLVAHRVDSPNNKLFRKTWNDSVLLIIRCWVSYEGLCCGAVWTFVSPVFFG